jgi:hypothetical protein
LELIEGNFGSSQGSAVAVSYIYLMGLHIVAFFCQVKSDVTEIAQALEKIPTCTSIEAQETCRHIKQTYT